MLRERLDEQFSESKHELGGKQMGALKLAERFGGKRARLMEGERDLFRYFEFRLAFISELKGGEYALFRKKQKAIRKKQKEGVRSRQGLGGKQFGMPHSVVQQTSEWEQAGRFSKSCLPP